MNPCTSCGENLPAAARFCFACGAEQAAPGCATCGEALVPGARFCFSCGTPTGTSVAHGRVAARRVTSVLFGDLVGFTSLSESRDQEEVRELLSRYFEECRRVIGRYGGTVEKFIGDAVMAVWGVPTAHEDDAERAVRAGLELVTVVASLGEAVGVAGLAMRVGVVTGEVAVTVGATQEGMVAGDAVNTAARVQAAAEPGHVWVDETTRLLTASAITYVDVGSHVMKGKADPVPLWAVRAVVAALGGAQRADGLEAPLIGRERELRLCKELFHASAEGRRPALMVVEGDPGVGKTRLAWEFEKYIDGLTGVVAWHSGRCLAYGEGVAFYALAEAVRGRLRSLHTDDELDDEAALLDHGLTHLVTDEEERAWLRPRVGALLGIGSVGSFPREDLFSAWVTFLHRAGGDDPVVLVVDDAHHADEGLLQFVEHVLASGGFGCFVVLLTRPGLIEERPALVTNRRATVVHLQTLADPDMAALLDGLVAGLPGEVRVQLVERAEGVPLYAVETVRSLIDRDFVVPRGGQYVLDPGTPLDLETLQAPASLQALVGARLDALTPGQRLVIDRASVLGESFAGPDLADLCPEVDDVDAVLAGLVRLQILRQETRRFSSEFGQHQFVQSVVRQVAFGRLSRRDRKAIHLAVVDLIRRSSDAADLAAVVAQHYLDAADAVPSDTDATDLQTLAVQHLEDAARRAQALGAPSEAAAHLTVALGLVTGTARTAALEAALARSLHLAGYYVQAVPHAARAVELYVEAGDRLSAAAAAAVQGKVLGEGLRDWEAALEVVDPWWTEVQGLDTHPEVRFEVCSAVASSRIRIGGQDELTLVDAFLRLAHQTGSPSAVAHAFTDAWIYHSGRGSGALARVLLKEAAELARSLHDPHLQARTLNNLSADYSVEDLLPAIEAARESLAVSTAAGYALFQSFASANLVILLWSAGEWDEVDRMLRDGDLAPVDSNQLIFRLVAELLSLARGNDPLVDPRADLSRWQDDATDRSLHLLLEGLGAYRAGDLASAAAQAVEAVEMQSAASGLWDDAPFLWRVAADLVREAGDDDLWQRLLAVTDEGARVGLLPVAMRAHLAHAVGARHLDDHDLEAAEQQLRTASAGYRAWGGTPFVARVEVDLARCLHALGRTEEAESLEASSAAAFETLRATTWVGGLDTRSVPRR